MYSEEIKLNASILREQKMSNGTIAIILSKKYESQFSSDDVVKILEEYDSENDPNPSKNERVDYLSDSDPKVIIALKLVSHWKSILSVVILAFILFIVCLGIVSSVQAAITVLIAVLVATIVLIAVIVVLVKTGVLMKWLDYLNDRKINKEAGAKNNENKD